MIASRLAVLFAVAAAPLVLSASIGNIQSLTPRNDTGDDNFPTCGDACNKLIDASKCAQNNLTCQCDQDFNYQVGYLKCLYDSCSEDDVVDVAGVYLAVCSDDFGEPPDTNATGTYSEIVPTTSLGVNLPTAAPAATFSLPSCGQNCLSKGNFTECGTALAPSCVCNSNAVNDTLNTPFNKCIFDSCSATDAAISYNGFFVGCGAYTPQVPSNQLPFPNNKFAAANASSSSSSTSSSRSATATSSQASSTPSHKSGASIIGVSGALSAAGALLIGSVLL